MTCSLNVSVIYYSAPSFRRAHRRKSRGRTDYREPVSPRGSCPGTSRTIVDCSSSCCRQSMMGSGRQSMDECDDDVYEDDDDVLYNDVPWVYSISR